LIAHKISQFWQNEQRRLQWAKKIVPEPFHPRRQSSSPKWGNADEATARSVPTGGVQSPA